MATGQWIESHVPARLDRLPWSRWHWLIVTALGATWILDGLEVTLAGSLGAILTHRETLALTDAQVGATATFYLIGAVLGAIVFGYATDRLGRKKLFFITVSVYLIATGLTAFSWSFASYAFFRALTGAGIGGEYAAINSAIDELIPARVRGRVDLIINGSYWVGAAMGSAATIFLLDPRRFPVWLGWRFAFGIGAILGLIVIFFRRWIPESPRWLMIHGHEEEAERIVDEVERKVVGKMLPIHDTPPTRIRTRTHTPWREIWNAIVHEHRRRSLLGFVLMLTQAFFYNAIFFTYGLVLMRFYNVPANNVGGIPVAICARKCARPVIARASFRYHRTQAHDHCDLYHLRNSARSDRLAFSRRIAHRTNADAGLEHHLFRCFRRRQFCLSDGQRNLPARNPCPRHRRVLCNRNTDRRSGCTAAVWLDHWNRIERSVVCWLSRWRCINDCGRANGGVDRRRCGTPLPRTYRGPIVFEGSIALR